MILALSSIGTGSVQEMDELVKLVMDKTGLPEETARIAV
jgi:hypothetical protein